ncbi:MAG: TRAP transporter large permease subunit, partial [Candidatus Calescibacterium sp.]
MLAVIVLLFVFLLAFSGTPLFAIMAIGAIFGFIYIADVDIAIVIQEAYRLASAPALIAIPLFTLAGYILAESRAPQRLLRFTKAWVGWLPGGVPLVVLVATSIFTALTGASGVTIVALGGLLLPILRNAGYSEIFSLGIITATGSIGLLFPPSLP